MKAFAILQCLVLSVMLVELSFGLSEHAQLTREALNTYNKLRKNREIRGLDATDADDILSLVTLLGRQMMLQGLAVQESVRSAGSSGAKQVRLDEQGTKSYHATSFTGSRFLAIHEHANNIRIPGIGELAMVLNGVEFRTRHNDYTLLMSHRNSSGYEETEEIPFPEVPPSVLEKDSPAAQIEEMQEFFKAWKNQDVSHRNYTKYFTSVLCYLEGGWTLSDENTIDESFESERHNLAADSWLDLQEKIRFTSYVGKKDALENYAYLPTTILELVDGTLKLAQWNYRINCHPLSRHIHPSRFVLMDDVQARMSKDLTMEQLYLTRSARFTLPPTDKDGWKDKKKNYGLLDELMEEVPGKDNYIGYIEDTSLDAEVQHYVTGEKLNAARYHRWFRTGKADAMGSSSQSRGFSDPNLFVALTTQEKIAPMKVKTCNDDGVCTDWKQRVTYAVPLEIISMTPLYNWNPYNIEYHGHARDKSAKVVTADERTGTEEKPLDGTHSRLYYRTPLEFFGGSEESGDSADTAAKNLWVLNKAGKAKQVAASGTRIKLPEIPGVGTMRMRFPIMPITQEGYAEWKEVEALKEVFLNPESNKRFFYEDFPSVNAEPGKPPPRNHTVYYYMEPANPSYKEHIHYVAITLDQFITLKETETLTVTTEESWGHTHELVLQPHHQYNMQYITCDGLYKCIDHHDPRLWPYR